VTSSLRKHDLIEYNNKIRRYKRVTLNRLMHRTFRLTDYITPLTLTLTLKIYLKRKFHYFDLLWICCTTSCNKSTTNRKSYNKSTTCDLFCYHVVHQTKPMEFGLKLRLRQVVSRKSCQRPSHTIELMEFELNQLIHLRSFIYCVGNSRQGGGDY